MPEDTVRPPDMVGAGLYQQPPDPASLIGLLRSQGSLPAESIGMLGGPPPSPGQAYASALSGGVSQMRGQPNPVAQQMAQQQQAQVQQAQLMQRVQEHKAKVAAQQEQRYLDMADTFLKSDDERTRTYGAKMRVGAAKRMGVELPDSIAEGMATRRLTDKESSDILVRLGMGYSDEMLARMYPDLKTDDLQGYKKLSQDPTALRAAGFDSDQVEKARLDMQIKAGQAMEAGHPELKGNGTVIQAATVLAQKQYGQAYLDLNPSQQGEVLGAARQQVQSEEERKIRMQSQLSLDRALLLAQIRADAAAKKPLTPLQKQKLLEGPKRARDTVAAMGRLEEQIDAMDRLGALPKGEDWFSQKAAQVKRETLLRGNQAVFNFKQAWAPISVGQIDRGLFDEKNVRFKQAFEQQTGVVDNMPPAAAMKSYLKVMRELVTNKATSDIADWEDLNYPDDVIAVSKRMLGIAGPQPLPQSPLTPPADLTYDPKTKKWGTPNAPR